MKKKLSPRGGSTLFLKFVLVLISLIVLAGLLIFPHTEGRARNLDFIQVYLDPLIIYVYITSIPFFVALYQAFKLLGYIDQNKAFSDLSVRALKKIKYCALLIPVLVIPELIFIRINANGDDPAGVMAIGIVVIFASFVVATFAAVLQKLLQNAADLKSENDLTV